MFVAEGSAALDEEEESPSFDDSEDSLTGKLSIDDYVVGDSSEDFYNSLLSLGSTQLERILNYSSFDLTQLLEDFDDEVEYSFDSQSMEDNYEDSSGSVGENASSASQQDQITYFIEKMLDYINPSTDIDPVNDSRDDGDDVIRRAKRWQFEVNFMVAGSEIALYREDSPFESNGYRKFITLRA